MTNLTKQKIQDARYFLIGGATSKDYESNEPIPNILGKYYDVLLESLDIAEKQVWLPIGITAMKEPEVLISGGTFGCNDGLCEISEIEFEGRSVSASYDSDNKLFWSDEHTWHKPTHYMPLPTPPYV